MYLVDTNVLSAGAPSKMVTAPGLVAWMDRNSADLFVSVITVTEIEDGIAKARRLGAGRKADRLAAWLETVLHLYAARVLPVDLETGRVAGGLADLARGLGRSPGLADLMIAATARRHGLTVLTRNVRDFEGFGVRVVDPFERVPIGAG